MRLLTFARFIRMITKKGPADLEKIQKMGLLAVKLTQIFAHYGLICFLKKSAGNCNPCINGRIRFQRKTR